MIGDSKRSSFCLIRIRVKTYLKRKAFGEIPSTIGKLQESFNMLNIHIATIVNLTRV